MEWWQNGVAGAWPSLACYILSVLGCFRLSRHLLSPRLALLATAFYALNPNLLYASTTALTEPLFLAILLWLTTLTLECAAAIRSAHLPRARRLLLVSGLLILAAVYTRYDGWILGAAAWIILAVSPLRTRQPPPASPSAFALFTLLAVVGPAPGSGTTSTSPAIGSTSCAANTPPPPSSAKPHRPAAKHYRGWHNMGWSLLFYTRTAQVDASFWETGFLLLAAALAGTWLLLRQTHPNTSSDLDPHHRTRPAHHTSTQRAPRLISTPEPTSTEPLAPSPHLRPHRPPALAAAALLRLLRRLRIGPHLHPPALPALLLQRPLRSRAPPRPQPLPPHPRRPAPAQPPPSRPPPLLPPHPLAGRPQLHRHDPRRPPRPPGRHPQRPHPRPLRSLARRPSSAPSPPASPSSWTPPPTSEPSSKPASPSAKSSTPATATASRVALASPATHAAYIIAIAGDPVSQAIHPTPNTSPNSPSSAPPANPAPASTGRMFGARLNEILPRAVFLVNPIAYSGVVVNSSPTPCQISARRVP